MRPRPKQGAWISPTKYTPPLGNVERRLTILHESTIFKHRHRVKYCPAITVPLVTWRIAAVS
jgi:hypothetical protein